MKRAALPLIAALGLLAGGCLGATRPDAVGGASPTTQDQVSYHGVIRLPGEDQTAAQGRRDPWFVSDQGDWLDLVLEPPFTILADPASAGRGVTLTGEVLRPEHVPVGAAEQSLLVTDYQFDPP